MSTIHKTMTLVGVISLAAMAAIVTAADLRPIYSGMHGDDFIRGSLGSSVAVKRICQTDEYWIAIGAVNRQIDGQAERTGAVALRKLTINNQPGATQGITGWELVYVAGAKAGSSFGEVVCFVGNDEKPLLLVGATHIPGNERGNAYLYDLSIPAGTSPRSPTARLEQPGGQPGDRFGFVARVGAEHFTIGNVKGNLYLYKLSQVLAGLTTPIHQLIADGDRRYGTIAADGCTLLIGDSAFGTPQKPSVGRADLYSIVNDQLVPVPSREYRRPSELINEGAHFGYSGATLGDLGLYAIGALYDFRRRGAVYLFDEGVATHPLSILLSPGSKPGGSLSYSMAGSAGALVVGALHEDGGGIAEADRGAAYAYQLKVGSQHVLCPTFDNFTSNTEDPWVRGFGASVAIDGRVVVVGAPYYFDDMGNAYVYRLP